VTESCQHRHEQESDERGRGEERRRGYKRGSGGKERLERLRSAGIVEGGRRRRRQHPPKTSRLTTPQKTKTKKKKAPIYNHFSLEKYEQMKLQILLGT